MAISDELRAQILRYHFVEHWRVGTIASQLRIHHYTVERVLSEAGVEHERQRRRRASKLDPYRAFITETLERFPTLTAARLFDMVKVRGYTGGPDHFRHSIAQLRPRRPREAYLRLRTLPGEQSQIDWAHFGKLTIGRAERPLMAFVLVLSYSRYPFVRFYLGASLANLIRGHVKAFSVLGGTANRYADLLFEVVTRRYLNLPVLITTNKPFSEWADVFSSAACVVTLVDRLIHRSEIVQLDGESYRLREAKEQAARRSNPSSATRRQNACNVLIFRSRKPKVGTTRHRAEERGRGCSDANSRRRLSR